MVKKNLKVLGLLMIFFSMFILAACEKDDKLYVATSPDYMPHEFVNKNEKGQAQYVGADIEFAKKIAEDMGKPLYIDAMGFTETLAAVQNGKVDLAISGFTYKKERAENYEMSISYFDDGDGTQTLITLKSNLEKFKNFELINKESVTVGAQSNSVQYDYAAEQLPNAKIEIISTINDGILYLKNGKIDVLAIASNAGEAAIASNPELAFCEESFDVTGKTGLFALAKKGNKELIELVNEIIKEVQAKQLYSQWLEEAKLLAKELGSAAVEEDFTSSGNQNFFVKVWVMFQENFVEFMKGLGITLALSLCGVVFAALFGIFLCLMNLSKYRILRIISNAYIEVIRGIPLLLQLTVIFLVMPKGMPKFITCVVALVINSVAYQAEIFRSGIQSVDKGQMEAARSLGLSYPKTMVKVILPQAIKNILPSLANEFVALIKETSLASTFFVGDLMTVKTIITSATYDALTPYVIIAVIYFIITFSLSKLIRYAEKKVTE